MRPKMRAVMKVRRIWLSGTQQAIIQHPKAALTSMANSFKMEHLPIIHEQYTACMNALKCEYCSSNGESAGPVLS